MLREDRPFRSLSSAIVYLRRPEPGEVRSLRPSPPFQSTRLHEGGCLLLHQTPVALMGVGLCQRFLNQELNCHFWLVQELQQLKNTRQKKLTVDPTSNHKLWSLQRTCCVYACLFACPWCVRFDEDVLLLFVCFQIL